MITVGIRHLSLAALVAASASVLATSAAADDLISVQLGVATEYLGKGIAKSNEKASVSGSIEIARSGFYANVFAASAELSQGADAEIVTSIGYRTTLAGFGVDAGVVNRELPGNRAGVDSNYTEFQTDLSRKFGAVSTRLRINYTEDGYAATQEAWWIELQGGVSLDRKTKLTVAVADRTAEGGAEYMAWNVGAKRKLTDRIAADLRWYDTDGHRFGDSYDGRLVGALTYSF